MNLILASTSRYRRELLQRIFPEFRQIAPEVDESPRPGESATALVQRLARAKAMTLAQRDPSAVVIGSDQVCVMDAQVLGKPGTVEAACAQLAALSGKSVSFLTAVCVASTGGAKAQIEIVPTTVRFRQLPEPEIRRYVERERPLDCAGSFKVEGLGIALFERVTSDDPTALIGLPLIATARMLRVAGVDPLA